MANPRVELSEIIEAYERLGSVWKAGAELGIGGQAVAKRLKASGVNLKTPRWSEDEKKRLAELADNGLTLAQISDQLNRTVPSIACKLNELGLKTARTGLRQRRKIPRGVGYDKLSVDKHLKVLERNPEIKITKYAKSQGLDIEHLVQAMQKHFILRFRIYQIQHHGDMEWVKCEYCGSEFLPSSGKAKYCSRICGSRARSDASYFGGKRRQTIGLEEGECQLCGRKRSDLHSQHVIGKKNDPDNKYLVALCPGCHRLVGLASRTRHLIESPKAWENFIAFAWFEANGAKIKEREDRKLPPLEIECFVDISISEFSGEDQG
jgi:hypothetical protein